MAVTEGEPGAGGGGRSGLSKWDRSVREQQRDLASLLLPHGSTTPKPERIPNPINRFDPQRFDKLTPYAVPQDDPAPSIAESGGGNWATYGQQRQENPNATGGSWRTYGQEMNQLIAEQKAVEGAADTYNKPKTRRTYQLTWDEYNKLSEDQRAAVDFNTLLVQAREKDLKHQEEYKPSEEQKAAYDEELHRMFGENAGSETYAPETLGVLKQIDFQSNGETLDDFLSLKETISARELKNFDLAVPDPIETSVPEVVSAVHNLTGQDRGAYNTGTPTRLAEAMAKAGDVLQSLRASAARNRNDEVLAFGGLLNEVHTAPGYGDRPTDPNEGNIHGFFQETLKNLSLHELDPVNVWATADKVLNPHEVQQFLQYADEVSKDPAKYDVVLKGVRNPRKPDEFRQLLGLDPGGE